MKIEEVERKYKNKEKATIAERVFNYLNDHADEVYRYDDIGLRHGLPNDKIESINYALWRLEKDKRIEKLKITPKVAYFGSKEAIQRLKKGLGR